MKATLVGIQAEANVLFPRLRFDIELENDSAEPVAVFNMKGRLLFEDREEIGSLVLLDNFVMNLDPKARGERAYLHLDTNPRLLEKIEENRKGGDMHLKINISYLYAKGKNLPAIDTIRSETIPVKAPDGRERQTIYHSKWLSVLQELKYSKYKVFEIKMPELPAGTQMDKGVQYLVNAQNMLNAGNYKEVILNCRQAMEEFQKIIDEKSSKISDKIDEGSNPPHNEDTKSKKLLELRKSIHKFLHIGAHPGYQVERKDAELALISTLSIGKYLAEVLLETK